VERSDLDLIWGIILVLSPRGDGYDTSAIAARVVEDDEKGFGAWEYRCAILSPGDVWSSGLGVRRKADDLALQKNYCHEIQRSENRMQSGRIL
jgi:hypothetical protein